MRYLVKTQNSSYVIDTIAKMWMRVLAGPNSGPIRGVSGNYNDISDVQVGKGLQMVCPPFRPAGPPRFIATSIVESIDVIGIEE